MLSSAPAKMTEREHLVNKKGQNKSTVWKHFGFKESDVEQQCIAWSSTKQYRNKNREK